MTNKLKKGGELIYTWFPPSWRALTSCEVNLAIDTDFTLCVNSRLEKCKQLKAGKASYLPLSLKCIFKENCVKPNSKNQRKNRQQNQENLKKTYVWKIKKKKIHTHCIPLQLVQTNVQKFVQTYCVPCLAESMLAVIQQIICFASIGRRYGGICTTNSMVSLMKYGMNHFIFAMQAQTLLQKI